ncbi:MAG: glycosyltransferase family 2 protein [Acidimicrobiales bacterium]|nr:glycosyltransferase family 2 protein [Acidimicrobiales bacterium]
MTEPSVVVVIPAKNAEKTIEMAIFSALNQKIDEPLEICICVAPSTDRTLEIAKRIAAKNNNVTLLENPSGKTPVGLNLAIRNTKARVIVRLDAHAELIEDNYISKAIETMQRTGAANVGGLQRPVGKTPFETAVGIAISSRFGAGDARFRIGGKSGEVDTVYLGVFDRNSIENIGLFDESLIRNQDAELNWRLRQAGKKIWFEPELAASYKPRSTLKELTEQYFNYGRWRRHVVGVHPRSIKWRQLIPPLNMVAFFAGLILGFLWMPLFIFPTVYALAVFSVTAVKSKTAKDFIYLMVIFPTIHFSWAAGFFRGIQN